MKTTTKLWIGIGILAVLSPLGLILPKLFHASNSWEKKFLSLWNAPMPDYAPKGWEGKGLSHLSVGYFLSSLVGVVVTVLVVLLLGRVLSKKK